MAARGQVFFPSRVPSGLSSSSLVVAGTLMTDTAGNIPFLTSNFPRPRIISHLKIMTPTYISHIESLMIKTGTFALSIPFFQKKSCRIVKCPRHHSFIPTIQQASLMHRNIFLNNRNEIHTMLTIILLCHLIDRNLYSNCPYCVKHAISSVHFSCSVVSDSLRPHELQHARLPCPSPTPRVHRNSCASSR